METLGDFLPASVLEKAGCTMPISRVVADRSLSKNLVYVPLVLSDINSELLEACWNDELREERAYAKVPAGMIVGNNKKDFPKIHRKILSDNGWVSEKAVLSYFFPDYNPMAQILNHEKWKFQDRVEIFGPFIEGMGVVELKPGVYDLNFPNPNREAKKNALAHGVFVNENNLEKTHLGILI